MQAKVECYFDCLTRMYSLFLKNFDFGLKGFQGVKSTLELLKVASQLQFDKLMDSISLHLSSRVWSEEDEILIREYAASPDFPRSHAEDLVARLGLNESEEDRHKQLHDMLQHLICTALEPSQQWRPRYRKFLEELLQHSAKPDSPPSNFARTVVRMLTEEARSMLVRIKKDCGEINVEKFSSRSSPGDFEGRVRVISNLLKALLEVKLADEFVQYFLHLDAIPKCLNYRYGVLELAELVLLIYQEVVAGRVPLRMPERMALLVNWHSSLKGQFTYYNSEKLLEDLNRVTPELFSTLPRKDRMEFIIALNTSNLEDFNDFISNGDLIQMLSKSRSWPAPLSPSADDIVSSETSSQD